MKVAIFSDTHLGYKMDDPELGRDSFEAAMEAMRKSIEGGVDVILIAGDIFDARVPRQEVWPGALEVFSLPRLAKSEARVEKIVHHEGREREPHPLNNSGIPVVAIYGTHERRGRGMINPVQLLERAGFLYCLHGETMILSKGGERLAITGMSGVPEAYARSVLDALSPKPVQGCYNIFVLHQSIEGYVYSDVDNPCLSIDDLPRGFDLVVDGHIHRRELVELDKGLLLFPGSTILTQARKSEAGVEKGISIVDTLKGDISFVPLEGTRPFYYEEVDCGGKTSEECIGALHGVLENISRGEHAKKPMVRVVLVGRAKEVVDQVALSRVEEEFSDRMILSIVSRVTTSSIERGLARLEELRSSHVSVVEEGEAILRENARKHGVSLDYSLFFDMLVEGDIDGASSVIEGLVSGSFNNLKETER